MPKCQNCNKEFPNRIKINGKNYNLTSRKFCIECSPINSRNTRSYIVDIKNNESFCARCNNIKDANKFYKRKENGKPLSYCIECQKEVKNLKLQEKLERIIEERNGICFDCKLPFPIQIFKFYNNGKIYQISKAKNMSIIKLQKELRNHIMLCLNCCAIRKWED